MQEILSKITDIFSGFSYYSALDIFFVSLLFYLLFLFLLKQNAKGIIKYLVLLLLFMVVVFVFKDYLKISSKVLAVFAGCTFLILASLFPYEFRRLIWKLSNPKEQQTSSNEFDCSDEELNQAVSQIVRAVLNMSKRNTGALIVFAKGSIPNQILESGVGLDSELSAQLLETIFITKGPLHDGAVFIRGNRIVSAGCFLPLSQNLSLPKELGTRHRAAMGVSENIDCVALIVSEETGVISVAKSGQLTRYLDLQMLTEELEQAFGLKAVKTKKRKRKEKK